MRRSTKHPAPFIYNDELEHDRIQLEHNLRNSETAIQLSSASESDTEPYYSGDDLESIEFPRHNSGPAPLDNFHPFDQQVRDYLTDEDRHGHGWSYHTADGYEEGINPYGAETISTVAHHTSAVTFSAGLGGRGAKREISISGAEYDPDRPLNDIIAGVNSEFSIFGTDNSPSRRLTIDNDPLVVEDTAELDQILETGLARPSVSSRSVRVASPVTSGSSSHSESDQAANSTLRNRPKLSDALHGVALSPKRPRSPQITRSLSLSPEQRATSTLSRGNSRNNNTHVPTPRPARRSNVLPPHAPSPQQPDLRLQPPTPSSTGSKFTRMARGLAKDIEVERGQLKSSLKRVERSHSAPTPDVNPFQDGAGQGASFSAKNRSRVQLPDVTGLTNAIESPAKLGVEYYAYRTEGKIRETENRLLQTLNGVQRKLQHLEEENGVSRRRVRELEMELEDCKREVARERTRLVEHEENLRQQHFNSRDTKGKMRESNVSADNSQLHERYKDAVEEKKALEVLINSLRAHLTRLTSELSSHRELLTELRVLRDVDSGALMEKGAEITRLKNEIERLAGEVEVLRGVVEEGLRERRAAKEASLQQDSANLEGLIPSHPSAEAAEADDYVDDEHESRYGGNEEEEDGEESEAEYPELTLTSDNSRPRMADKTMRTDHATQGSSRVNDTRGTRFMDSAEFERISAEIDERRSDRSGTVDLSQFSHTRSPAQSPSPRSRSRADDTAAFDASTMARRASSPSIFDQEDQEHEAEEQEPDPYLPEAGASSRPLAAANGHELRSGRRPRKSVDPPFPRIRGEHLERLFFSVPEHNAQTCTTCNRGRQSDDRPASPSRAPRTAARHAKPRFGNEQDDEGFAESPDEQNRASAQARDKGKQRERSLQDINEIRFIARQEGLPPQTIVARIIRELEDDFTHYKSIYIELADQYKEMDAASNVAKRNALAQHLREVVDILEQKGDQIASLYDLLAFRDKPAERRAGTQRSGASTSGKRVQERT